MRRDVVAGERVIYLLLYLFPIPVSVAVGRGGIHSESSRMTSEWSGATSAEGAAHRPPPPPGCATCVLLDSAIPTPFGPEMCCGGAVALSRTEYHYRIVNAETEESRVASTSESPKNRTPRQTDMIGNLSDIHTRSRM